MEASRITKYRAVFERKSRRWSSRVCTIFEVLKPCNYSRFCNRSNSSFIINCHRLYVRKYRTVFEEIPRRRWRSRGRTTVKGLEQCNYSRLCNQSNPIFITNCHRLCMDPCALTNRNILRKYHGSRNIEPASRKLRDVVPDRAVVRLLKG